MESNSDTRTTVYHNDLNQIKFNLLSAVEQNIFVAALHKAKDKGSEEITIDRFEFKKLTNLEWAEGVKFDKLVDETASKLLSMQYKKNNEDGSWERFILFRKFKLNVDGNLDIKVEEDFMYILNDLNNGSFTKFLSREFMDIKSIYAKELYRRLMMFKSTGVLRVKVNDFDEWFQVPKSYNRNLIHQRILDVALAEVKTIDNFNDLSVEIIRSSRRGKPVTHYKFTWTGFKKLNNTRKEVVNSTPETKESQPQIIPIEEIPTMKFGHSFEEKQIIVKAYQVKKSAWRRIAKEWDIDNPTIKKYEREVQEQELEDLPFK